MRRPEKSDVSTWKTNYKCRGCGSTEIDRFFEAREMMFGMRDAFTYSVCGTCGSAQIEDREILTRLAEYYPSNYYSHESSDKKSLAKRASRYLKDKLDVFEYTGKGIIGYILSKTLNIKSVITTLKRKRIERTDRVLDVGCGDKAEFLLGLERMGFEALTGCDPFVERSKNLSENIYLHKGSIDDLKGVEFDVIVSNHSFEHMFEPEQFFSSISDVSHEGTLLLVSCPTTTSWAFDEFQENWVQLDAPRHLFIPSRSAMNQLAQRFGFVIERVVDNSTSFQIIASERYRNDEALRDQDATVLWLLKSIFAFLKARKLNKISMGDQCIFVIQKIQ